MVEFAGFQISFAIIAIASAFFASIANILARTLLRNLRSQDILAINFLMMAAVLLLISPAFYHFEVSWLAAGLVILVASIDAAANYFYFKAFEKTEASVATPILSLAPGFTFFFGFLFLGEVATLATYLIAIAIIALIIYFSSDLKNFRKFRAATLAPALTASVLFGISAIPSKILLSELGVINAPTLYMFRAGLIGLYALLFFGFTIPTLTVTQYRIIFVRSLFVIAQWVLLYLALTHGTSGVTITLGNITPIFVFLLSTLFLAEKPTFKKLCAALLILALSLIVR